jgi:hypothetical protein
MSAVLDNPERAARRTAASRRPRTAGQRARLPPRTPPGSPSGSNGKGSIPYDLALKLTRHAQQQKSRTHMKVRAAARDLHEVSEQLADRGRDSPARIVEHAANGLDTVASGTASRKIAQTARNMWWLSVPASAAAAWAARQRRTPRSMIAVTVSVPVGVSRTLLRRSSALGRHVSVRRE